MTLLELLQATGIAPPRGPAARIPVAGIADDHRKVRPGFLFVARRGASRDGAAFVPEAARRGAAAVVAQSPVEADGLLVIRVPDAASALAALADAFLGRPARALTLVGITGTNGKTTTAFLVRSILEAAGIPAGLVGTVVYRVGAAELPSEATTPGILRLREILAAMRDAGLKACAMEVSSHALAQGRVRGIPFSAAVFTNLARDHLDYHGTPEEYGRAKGRLFESLPPGAAAVLNARDPASGEYARRTGARVVRYGFEDGLEVSARILEMDGGGMVLSISDGQGAARVESALVGRHNAENVLAAAAAARAVGVPWTAVAAGARAVPAVPGRLEPVDEGQPFRVLVDYAHTEDGLRKVLEALRPVTRGRLLVLFGCGGDRDRSKRPAMGRAAAELSDGVYLTSDNPRSEDPRAILEEILAGGPFRVPLAVIPDRREAIGRAVREARPGDTLLVAGKGHETVQILSDRTVPFDDRAVVREALAAGGAA